MKKYRVWVSYQPEKITGFVDVEADNEEEAIEGFDDKDIIWDDEDAYIRTGVEITEARELKNGEY